MKKNNLMTLKLVLLTILSMGLVLWFNQELLKLASEDFIKNYLIILSISLFGLGYSAFQIKGNSELKKDLLSASIYYIFPSMLFSLIYLAYNKNLFLNINFATLSIWAFLGGFFYFFLILVKERMNL